MWIQIASLTYVEEQPVLTASGFVNLRHVHTVAPLRQSDQNGNPLNSWTLQATLTTSGTVTLLGVLGTRDEAMAAANDLLAAHSLADLGPET